MHNIIILLTYFIVGMIIIFAPPLTWMLYEYLKYGNVFKWHKYKKKGIWMLRRKIVEYCISGDRYIDIEYKPINNHHDIYIHLRGTE